MPHARSQEKNGLLWVWPDTAPHAAVQAACTPTCAPAEHDESRGQLLWLATWFVRDVPYGADVLAENILDPSHVQFSHHKVIGNRNSVSILLPSLQAALCLCCVMYHA